MASNNELTIDGLILLIDKMRYDIDQTLSYIDKLRQDKAKMRHTMQYNKDNLSYLRTHCGVIAIDYVKSIRNQIKRLQVFLDHAENDISKFEKIVEKQQAELDKKKVELENLRYKMASKVVEFRGKNK